MHSQFEPPQSQAPAMFTNTIHNCTFKVPTHLHYLVPCINSKITQGYGLATGPLHYNLSSNMGSFYYNFSEPAMMFSKDIIVLLLGIVDDPH